MTKDKDQPVADPIPVATDVAEQVTELADETLDKIAGGERNLTQVEANKHVIQSLRG